MTITEIQCTFAGRVIKRPTGVDNNHWDMFVSHVTGTSYKEIGVIYGLTAQRIRQICNRVGLRTQGANKPKPTREWLPVAQVYLKPSEKLLRNLEKAEYQREEMKYNPRLFRRPHA